MRVTSRYRYMQVFQDRPIHLDDRTAYHQDGTEHSAPLPRIVVARFWTLGNLGSFSRVVRLLSLGASGIAVASAGLLSFGECHRKALGRADGFGWPPMGVGLASSDIGLENRDGTRYSECFVSQACTAMLVVACCSTHSGQVTHARQQHPQSIFLCGWDGW